MPPWSESLALLSGLRATRRLRGGSLVVAALAGWVLAAAAPAFTAPVWPYETDRAPLAISGEPASRAGFPLHITVGAPAAADAPVRAETSATFLEHEVVLRSGGRTTTLTREDYALALRALVAACGLALSAFTWPLLVLAVRMLRRARGATSTLLVVSPMMMQAALPGAVAAVGVGLAAPLAGHADGTRLAAALCLGMMAANSVLVACAPAPKSTLP